MAQKVQVILEDDIDGGPATGTVSFALDGSTYEIDLNEENAAKLRDSIAEWIRHARKTGRLGRTGATRRAGSAARNGQINEVREWLRDNGHQVSSRGRIPANLRAIYDAAH